MVSDIARPRSVPASCPGARYPTDMLLAQNIMIAMLILMAPKAARLSIIGLGPKQGQTCRSTDLTSVIINSMDPRDIGAVICMKDLNDRRSPIQAVKEKGD